MNSTLITGGTGFIGSHTCVKLLESGRKIIILDSLANSSKLIIERLVKICNLSSKNLSKRVTFIQGDIRSFELLDKIFFSEQKNNTPIDSVVHLAGLKSIEESIRLPIDYWDVNVNGSINLLKIMKKYECFQIVFSSSASIYGVSDDNSLKENAKINPTNTYAKTKVAVEEFLYDVFKSAPNKWKIACLRYFNPIGAHQSGLIGENPLGIKTNIFPHLIKVASGKEKNLKIFGDDWPTHDGTGIRDYIHIMDVAEGHCAALSHLNFNSPQIFFLNLGRGVGTSVLELINVFEEVNGCKIPYIFSKRRSGDVASLIADNKYALEKINWKPKRNLYDMCKDGWKWQKNNPNGYC